MNKILLIAFAVLLVSGVLRAEYGHIGPFADEAHSICSVNNPEGSILQFRTWIWILPSENGMIAGGFKISYPSNVADDVFAQNPDISISLGSPSTGIDFAFAECHMGWTWLCYQECYLLDSSPSQIQVVPHPSNGASTVVEVANCQNGFPLEPLVTVCHLFLNQPCYYSVESITWGSIKGLYK